MQRRPFLKSAVYTAIGSLTSGLGFAQSSTAYPNRPVKMMVPLAPGGGSDAIARLLSANLTEKYGQAFVVENRPAASGIVGTDAVAKAAPDGYTLLTVFSTHAMSAELFKKLPYDPVKDFAPVSLTIQSPLVLLVNPSLPINNFKEFVAYAKANPGKLNYGSSGQGSAPHLMTEQMNAMAGIKTTHVPYKGVAPITLALVQNEIQFALANIFTTLPMVKAGRLRMIATGGLKRSLLAPDVPTIAESGLTGYDSVVWYGVLAPAKTPPAIIEELSKEIATILRKPEIVKTITDGGNEPVGSTPQYLAQVMADEAKKWGAIGRKLGVELE
jgi:tripartite-type tricarboxylate transporter receptor subunit TctC